MLAGDGPTLKLTRKIHTLGLFIEITTQQIINLKPNLPPSSAFGNPLLLSRFLYLSARDFFTFECA
jgi:hypothetical protein